MRRTVAGLVLPALLLALAACGSDEPTPDSKKAREGAVGDITVSGDFGASPTVDFKAPVSFPSSESDTVINGPDKGDKVSNNSTITVNYVGINASDGTEFDSSWPEGEPATFAISQVINGFANGLMGAQAGDRVLLAIASKDGYDPVGNGTSIAKGDSLVFVVDVEKVKNPLAEATGTPSTAPPTVPRLVYDDEDHPKKFTATKAAPKTLADLGVFTIIEGEGPRIESGQTVTVEYVGQLYPDGRVFDESWSRDDLVSFPIGTGGVIEGWDRGLVGEKVGSRVILTIPSKLGYGKTGQPDGGIPADADLIFAIDILAID